MKKYLVIRVYTHTTPSVIFMTDIKEDAISYAEILHRSDDGEYKVSEVL